MAYAARKRRISHDLSNGSNLSSSLQIPMPQPTISLRASGLARLIFRSDPTSFDGVLITDNGEETYSITGKANKNFLSENNFRRLVDISISDGETGQLFIIRRVDLLPPSMQSSSSETEDMEMEETEHFKTLSAKNFKAYKKESELALDAGLSTTNMLTHESLDLPHYELRSDVLQFQTDEVLVGNRADKEIRTFLNPALVGRLLNVHMGQMNVEFSTPVTPPSTPVFERQRRRSSCHVSICATNDNEACQMTTDADINFLM